VELTPGESKTSSENSTKGEKDDSINNEVVQKKVVHKKREPKDTSQMVFSATAVHKINQEIEAALSKMLPILQRIVMYKKRQTIFCSDIEAMLHLYFDSQTAQQIIKFLHTANKNYVDALIASGRYQEIKDDTAAEEEDDSSEEAEP